MRPTNAFLTLLQQSSCLTRLQKPARNILTCLVRRGAEKTQPTLVERICLSPTLLTAWLATCGDMHVLPGNGVLSLQSTPVPTTRCLPNPQASFFPITKLANRRCVFPLKESLGQCLPCTPLLCRKSAQASPTLQQQL